MSSKPGHRSTALLLAGSLLAPAARAEEAGPPRDPTQHDDAGPARDEALHDDAGPARDEAHRAALEHFQRGLQLFDAQDFESALAEFSRSRELYPTRAATKNAALCAKHLRRYELAAELIRALLSDARVAGDEQRALRAELEEVEAFLGTIEVRSSESAAEVWIDSVLAGRTPLAPRAITTGDHRIRVVEAGPKTYETIVRIASRELVVVQVPRSPSLPLEPRATPRVPPSVRDRPRGARAETATKTATKTRVELGVGLALTNSLGGDVSDRCRDGCSSQLRPGFWGTGRLEFARVSGIEAFFEAGYMLVRSRLDDRPVHLHPVNLEDNAGRADDSLSLSGALLGTSAAYSLGCSTAVSGRCRPFLRLGLGAGVLLGSARDERTGSASSNRRANPNWEPGTSEPAEFPAEQYRFAVAESAFAAYGYVSPEVRAGFELSARWAVALGVRGYALLALHRARFENRTPIYPGPDYHVGQLTFDRETTSGALILVISPAVSLIYSF